MTLDFQLKQQKLRINQQNPQQKVDLAYCSIASTIMKDGMFFLISDWLSF